MGGKDLNASVVSKGSRQTAGTGKTGKGGNVNVSEIEIPKEIIDYKNETF